LSSSKVNGDAVNGKDLVADTGASRGRRQGHSLTVETFSASARCTAVTSANIQVW
jgi:hypothetical protein